MDAEIWVREMFMPYFPHKEWTSGSWAPSRAWQAPRGHLGPESPCSLHKAYKTCQDPFSDLTQRGSSSHTTLTPKAGQPDLPSAGNDPLRELPCASTTKDRGPWWRGTNSHCPGASPSGDEANISSSCQKSPGVKLEANFWRKRTVPQRPENAVLVSERPTDKPVIEREKP